MMSFLFCSSKFDNYIMLSAIFHVSSVWKKERLHVLECQVLKSNILNAEFCLFILQVLFFTNYECMWIKKIKIQLYKSTVSNITR